MATIALIIVVVAAVFQAGFLLRRENRRDPVSHWLLAAAAALLLATLVQRSLWIRFAAVTNTYESLLFFSAAICVVLFILRLARRTRGFSPFVLFGATVIALALLAISSSPLAPSGVQLPIPALRSYWLVLHVTFSFIGEAFFVVSFVAAIAWFAARGEERRADLDRLVAASIGVGYPVFTAGALVFGSIWAETAWGAWWSWDPKETWALATWLVYTAYLHTRLATSLRGKVSSLLAIIGFAATLFTFLGVNYLLNGLHSYG
jgi:ABC-type transport system involved in cytochrome c biogenesis permease subunit